MILNRLAIVRPDQLAAPLAVSNEWALRAPSRARWARRWALEWYILALCGAPAVAFIASGLSLQASPELLLSAACLSVSSFVAFWILSDRPLLNPVQALALMFHSWFAVGPAACVSFFLLIGRPDTAIRYLEVPPATLWIVSAGLPLYALAACATIRLLPQGPFGYAKYLLPAGQTYRPRTIVLFWTAGLISLIVLTIASSAGYAVFETVNFLGGTVTNIWWLAALGAIGALADFGTLGGLAYVGSDHKRDARRWIALTAIAILTVQAFIGLTSGFKSPIITGLLWFALSRVASGRRLPWKWLLAVGVLYLAIVEPFVTSARILAGQRKVVDPLDRAAVFIDVMFQPQTWLATDVSSINIESPFRGIYLAAGEMSRMSQLYEGPWHGETFPYGLYALVPRALAPDKPEMNMGNFFARELGISPASDSINNIGFTLPFEFVGNFGYASGVIAFGFVGMLWAAFAVSMLTATRLETHPLLPFVVMLAFSVQASLGQLLSRFRDLPLLMIGAYVVWRLTRRRL